LPNGTENKKVDAFEPHFLSRIGDMAFYYYILFILLLLYICFSDMYFDIVVLELIKKIKRIHIFLEKFATHPYLKEGMLKH
jgi:hypothetical protein